MIKTIAIPVDENGMLDGHFGHSVFFEIVAIENKKIIKKVNVKAPPHAPGVLPKWLAGYNVTDVISGGIGKKALKLLSALDIHVVTGAPGLKASILVNGYLDGAFSTSLNHCDHDC